MVTRRWPANGKFVLLLTFSSQRTGTPQLFVTAVVVDAGTISTYPALYLWNQPPDEGNHTPSWDNYQIPPIIVP